MTFKTHLNCVNPDANNLASLFVIPGGPGLSGRTLKGIESLSRTFRVFFSDPPGTGDAPSLPGATFETFCDDIEKAALSIPGPVVLMGHSFGGLVALELALRGRLKSLAVVAIGAPLSQESYKSAGKRYQQHMTDKLNTAEAAFESAPSNETFRKWLSSYGILYFSPDTATKGETLISDDHVDVTSFKLLGSSIPPRVEFAKQIQALTIPKLLIAGEIDELLPVDVLSKDASRAGMRLVVVPKAGHFSFFDQPEEFSRLVEQALEIERKV